MTINELLQNDENLVLGQLDMVFNRYQTYWDNETAEELVQLSTHYKSISGKTYKFEANLKE